MPKTNQWKITMVNFEQLPKKQYPGFNTPKAIQQFCIRYNINCFWWRPPQGTKKVFMVDAQNFRRCYNQVYYGKGTTTGTNYNFTSSCGKYGTTTTKRSNIGNKSTRATIRGSNKTWSSTRSHGMKRTTRRAA